MSAGGVDAQARAGTGRPESGTKFEVTHDGSKSATHLNNGDPERNYFPPGSTQPTLYTMQGPANRMELASKNSKISGQAAAAEPYSSMESDIPEVGKSAWRQQ